MGTGCIASPQRTEETIESVERRHHKMQSEKLADDLDQALELHLNMVNERNVDIIRSDRSRYTRRCNISTARTEILA